MERKLLEKVLDNMEDTDLTYDRIQKLMGKLKKREKTIGNILRTEEEEYAKLEASTVNSVENYPLVLLCVLFSCLR